MSKTAAEILADLKEAFPLEDVEDVLNAVATALEDYAAFTKDAEPYATVSIRRHEAAAATVSGFLHHLEAEA